MKLTWDKNSSAYAAASKAIFEKYKDINESIVVQLREKHREEDKWDDFTILFLNDGEDWANPKYIWEWDWWEGEKFVELLAAAPVGEIDITSEWGM